MPNLPLVILNPASAAGRTGRRKAAILARIEEALGETELVETGCPGDATSIARKATEAGRETLLVAGGDGTLSEVANGVLAATAGRDVGPTIGLLPLGSGFDFARSLDLPRELDAALAVIAEGGVRRVDALQIDHADAGGVPRSGYVVNEAGAGLSATTIRVVGRFAKRVGARIGFAFGAVAAILAHRAQGMEIEIDGEPVYSGPVSLVVAANGCYFGAGMKVAPRASVDDGCIEVVIVRGLSVPALLANLPSLFAGKHGSHPQVSFHSARSVSIAPLASSRSGAEVPGLGLDLDLDGEPIGIAPLRAEIMPGALRVFARPEPAAGETGREG